MIKDREKAIDAICYVLRQCAYSRFNSDQDRGVASAILNRLLKGGYLNDKTTVHANEIQNQLEQALFKCKTGPVSNWTKIVNKKGLVFWRDNKTGLLWSTPLSGQYTFDEAIMIPQEVFKAELGKFKNRKWGVPTRDEIAVAIYNGLLERIPDMESFWSASVFSSGRSFAWLFYGLYGNVTNFTRSTTYVVRCVGRP